MLTHKGLTGPGQEEYIFLRQDDMDLLNALRPLGCV